MKIKKQVYIGRKYFQTTDPTENEYLEYIKNSKNSIVKIKQSSQKMSQKHRYFNEEDIQIASRDLERCLTSLAFRETQTEIT